jgi:hypothetical protein
MWAKKGAVLRYQQGGTEGREGRGRDRGEGTPAQRGVRGGPVTHI